jgi:transcriptional regulator with XRE-family HTH domain
MKLEKAEKTGNRLKVLRVRARLTIAELAEKANLNPATISLTENKHRSPTPETAIALAQALGFDPNTSEEAAAILGVELSTKGRPKTQI